MIFDLRTKIDNHPTYIGNKIFIIDFDNINNTVRYILCDDKLTWNNWKTYPVHMSTVIATSSVSKFDYEYLCGIMIDEKRELIHTWQNGDKFWIVNYDQTEI